MYSIRRFISHFLDGIENFCPDFSSRSILRPLLVALHRAKLALCRITPLISE